jgi:hypothetical protein
MTGIKGAVVMGMQVLCRTRPYMAPLAFTKEESRNELDSTIFNSWARLTYLSAFSFNRVLLPNSSASNALDLVTEQAQARVAPSVLKAYGLDATTLQQQQIAGAFDVSVYYNESLTRGQDLPMLFNLLTNALFRTFANDTAPGAKLEFFGAKDFPSPPRKIGFDLVSLVAPMFFLFMLELLQPVVLGALVYEKEYKQREIMKVRTPLAHTGLEVWLGWGAVRMCDSLLAQI